ncbi:cell division protein FtsL [Oceanospirillum linum]|uniref:Cell division protein FtsL n=1 Tax=Oceanospirillum linum TaxID=966 RepID=A0A1T1HEZ6_OCELI|nr:cell division protein FtsL [Oceanospirillum linum]OOV88431.1 cell division protein FtsL [Oceanospirillum linum]SEF56170.1 cell division protein FtsL [Oleiphilus messinensis]SMP05397.1 cell division protein FtsL [Oceanospirillum linum]
MSSEPVTSRKDVSGKGATRRAEPRQPLFLQVRSELLALLPETLSYSARLFIGFSLLTLISSLLVVYAAYENRLAYAALQNLEKRQRHYDVEWGQLLLERSTLASPSRIESIARKSLQMRQIQPESIQVLNASQIRAEQSRSVTTGSLASKAVTSPLATDSSVKADN